MYMGFVGIGACICRFLDCIDGWGADVRSPAGVG